MLEVESKPVKGVFENQDVRREIISLCNINGKIRKTKRNKLVEFLTDYF